jgi:hypothetical protein
MTAENHQLQAKLSQLKAELRVSDSSLQGK